MWPPSLGRASISIILLRLCFANDLVGNTFSVVREIKVNCKTESKKVYFLKDDCSCQKLEESASRGIRPEQNAKPKCRPTKSALTSYTCTHVTDGLTLDIKEAREKTGEVSHLGSSPLGWAGTQGQQKTLPRNF